MSYYYLPSPRLPEDSYTDIATLQLPCGFLCKYDAAWPYSGCLEEDPPGIGEHAPA